MNAAPLRIAARCILGVCLLGAAYRGAQAAWDFNGSAGVHESWSQNTTFSARQGNGDAISALSTTGRAARTTPRSKFDVAYTPVAFFYRDQTELNRVSHAARWNLAWNLGRRSTLTLNQGYYYTPLQGISGESFNTPIVLTRYTDRRNSNAAVGYQLQFTPLTRMVADARYGMLSYSDYTLIDSRFAAAGLRVERDLTPAMTFEAGARYTENSFSNPFCAVYRDPNDTSLGCLDHGRDYLTNDVPSIFTGLRRSFGSRFSASARAGYNLVVPDSTERPKRRGTHGSANVSWNGVHLTAQAGFNQDISAGSGVLTESRTQASSMSLGCRFGPSVTGNVIVNRSSSRTLDRNNSRSALTFNGQAELAWQIGQTMSATAGFSRYIQNSNITGAPDLGFNRYTVGLVANFK